MIDFFLMYIIGAVIGGLCSVFVHVIDPNDRTPVTEIGYNAVLMGAVWPLIAVILLLYCAVNVLTVIGLPFAGLAWVGRYLIRKVEKND